MGMKFHQGVFNLELFCSRHGKEVDWWSFGILAHDILTGAPPFTGGNRKVITERVLKSKRQLKQVSDT